ncbi:MAG TPA: penicillin-binding transpeptidase domain-containing protein, partial [Micromonosporaceae bacterium]
QALARRGYVLEQMVDLGMVTRAEADAAKAAKLKVTGMRTPNGCVSTTVAHWGFFCDFFYRWWLDQKEFGRDQAEREAKLKAGGYRIVTTMDPKVQDSANRNILAEMGTSSADALMLAAIEPGTGYVRAMAANRIYGLDTSKNKISSDPAKAKKGIRGTYPVTTNPLISGGGDIRGYKAGSTFKMFTMLAALEKGFPLDFNIVARSPYKSPIYIVGTNDISVCPDKVHWCPKNANPEYMNGPRNMWTGFGRSVNTYFVPLQEKVGADMAIAMAKRLGVKFRSSTDLEFTTKNPRYFGPFTIGVTDTVPLELANAYATVAAEGKYCEPMPVLEIYNNKGEKLEGVTEPRCKQVVAKEVARAAAEAARCPIGDQGGLHKCDGGTVGSYFTNLKGKKFQSVTRAVEHPLFGKTGTADLNWTANLVISSKQLAIAATGADPDLAEKPHQNEFPQKTNRAAVHTMRDALKGLPKIDFIKPPTRLVVGKRVNVPKVECKTVAQAKAAITAAGFDVMIADEPVESTCAKDLVAKTDPEGSTSKGSTIIIFISNGEAPKPDPSPSPEPGGGPGGPPGGR